jgi:hypothetical protein
LEGHPAVPEPVAEPIPPDDTDIPLSWDRPSRRADRHPPAPLPLDYLRAKAEAMTDIGVPGHLLGADPPDDLLPMDTLRALLVDYTIPQPDRDAAWRYLINNAITQRGRWYIYAIGVVALRLTEKAHYLTPGGKIGYPDDKRDVHQHLAVGFLAELYNVEVDDERIGDRILWRAVYRAKQAWWANKDVPWPPSTRAPEPAAPPLPAATPPYDDQLAPAIRALVLATREVKPSRSDRRPKLTAQDAALVALCCVFGRTIDQAAQEIGMSRHAARSKLPRIKRAVFALLASDYLKHKHPGLLVDPKTTRRQAA